MSSLIFNMIRLQILTTIYFLYFSGVLALPTIDDNEITNEDNANNGDEEKETCDEIFANNGMNYSTFYEGAAHGIHSLSLEEIRHFFKADAPEHNRIPTVNIDFRSEDVIHFNAPLWGYENRFDSWALKIMDWFMLNDQPYLYQNRANTMEKITHQYHMHEIYERASVIYNELVENPPKNVNGFCGCATDLTDNGIMSEVVNIARQLKHFGGKSRTGRAREPSCEIIILFYVQIYRCPPSRGKRSIEDEEEEDTTALMDNYLANSTKETASEIVFSSSKWTPGTLVGPKFDNWVPYSAMMTYSLPDDNGIRDFAHFMYCMLNHQ